MAGGEQNSIFCHMYKDQLFELIKTFKKSEKIFCINRLIIIHGTTVHLPPYMCEMNLIELAQAPVKCHMRKYYVTYYMSLKSIQEEQRVQANQKLNVTGRINHIKKMESELQQKDRPMEEVTVV